MKVAAVVILYNPPKDVVNNIRSYAGFVDKVYAIDNYDNEPAPDRKENDLKVVTAVGYTF